MSEIVTYDAVTIGGGPAGLSAAQILGRSRRRVLICDSGEHRNAASQAMRGFLSRDGIDPGEFLRVSRDQLGVYDTVELQNVEATDLARGADKFEVTLENGTRVQ